MENLKLLSNIALSFQNLKDFDKDMDRILDEIGIFLDISRVGIFLKERDGIISNTFEWCNSGVDPKIHELQNIKYNNERYISDYFIKKGYISTKDILNLPKYIVEAIIGCEINSILVYPLTIDGEIMGFISFNGYKRNEEWTKGETKLLSVASGIIANAYERKFYKDYLSKEKENCNLFYKIFESSPLPMSVVNMGNREVVKINSELLSITGYEEKEIIERKIEELDIFLEAQEVRHMLNRLKDDENIRAKDIVIKNKDGSFLHGIFNIEKITYKGKESLLIVMVDITESVKLANNLEDKLQKLSHIIEGAKLGTWEWDIQQNELILNEQTVNTLGYTLSELEPINIEAWKKRTNPKDLELSNKLIKDHMAGKIEYYDCEIRMKHKDGRWVWVHNRGKIIKRDSEDKPTKMFGTSVDITIRKKQALELERFFSINLDLLCIVDIKGNFIKINKAWEKTLGYKSEELIGKNFKDFIHKDDIEDAKKRLGRLDENGEVKQFVNRYKNANGEYRYIEWRSNLYEDILYAAARDITERINYENRILELSNRDVLTNVYNRRYVFDRAEELLEGYRRTKKIFSVCILDIDNFKNINDKYGHQVGDEVLKEFTSIIEGNLRICDVLGRYGGEEFIVLLNDASRRTAVLIMERILNTIRNKIFTFRGVDIEFTFSAGISNCEEVKEDYMVIDNLVEIADKRMYIAKNNGKNNIISKSGI